MPFSWATLFFDQKMQLLCDRCQECLEQIIGERCITCSRLLSQLSADHYQDQVCLDCMKWSESGRKFLDSNHSFFVYNEFLKDMMARAKYRGDYILLKVFAQYFRKSVLPGSVVVPIPLSEERHLERGFNQAEAIGTLACIEMIHALTRVHNEKQAKKNRAERLNNAQVFQTNGIDLTGCRVTLLDDIYTTGATLNLAAQELKQTAGAVEVRSLTIARSTGINF